ncbi:MAG: cbb3-type cytochrome oxidase assembly protein CcoS [Gammaproteobacteria bacterium]|nr:cbb3-type cytochrome oxidase assembly protein CcoS [Gammaproteobacteria bacterium]
MDVIYGLIPGMILLGLLGVGVFFWAARTGQFEDLEGEASRILMDDDLPPEKPVVKNPASYEVSEQKSSDQQG